MTESFGSSLNEVESMVEAIQAAFDNDDLMLAGSLNVALDARLLAVGEWLDATAAAVGSDDLEIVVLRLSAILERHRALGNALAGLRDRVGEELVRLRRGRLGAAEFLETAGA